MEEHKAYITQNNLDIQGRIYFSKQGVNAQWGGKTEDAMRYVEWFKNLPLWQVRSAGNSRRGWHVV